MSPLGHIRSRGRGPLSREVRLDGTGSRISVLIAEGWGLGARGSEGLRRSCWSSQRSWEPVSLLQTFPEAQAGEEEGKYAACFLLPPEFHSSFGFCFYSLVSHRESSESWIANSNQFQRCPACIFYHPGPRIFCPPPPPLFIGFLLFVAGFQALFVSTSWLW